MAIGSLLFLPLLALLLAAGQSADPLGDEQEKDQLADLEKEYGIDLTNEERKYLEEEFGDKEFNFWDMANTWGDQTDYEGRKNWFDRISKALKELPPMPEMYTSAELQDIYNRATEEIDAENTAIQQLYDSILNRQTDAYRSELDASNDAYNAYVNQILANNMQTQNAMQGAYRTELDRAQRNAISRGASAASRLVSNINANLGLQNQAAQQSLDTSNNLAQALLNQRQAAAGLRQQYSADLNTNAAQTADLRKGATERKHAYGTEQQNYAQYLRENDYNIWDQRITDEYGDDPVMEGMLRRRASQRSRTSTRSTI